MRIRPVLSLLAAVIVGVTGALVGPASPAAAASYPLERCPRR
jgi:hypothetical protein